MATVTKDDFCILTSELVKSAIKILRHCIEAGQITWTDPKAVIGFRERTLPPYLQETLDILCLGAVCVLPIGQGPDYCVVAFLPKEKDLYKVQAQLVLTETKPGDGLWQYLLDGIDGLDGTPGERWVNLN